MNRQTFTISDLLDFCVGGQHFESFHDSVRFVQQFAENHLDLNVDAEIEAARRRWCEDNGYDYAEIYG